MQVRFLCKALDSNWVKNERLNEKHENAERDEFTVRKVN